MPTSNFLSINVGTTANSKEGDTLRAAFQKINQNFSEIDGLIQEYFDDFLDTDNLLPTDIRPTTPNTNVTIESTGTGVIILNAPIVQISNDVSVGGSIAITDDITANDAIFTGDLEIQGTLSISELNNANIDCGKF
jgi:hypothetical protein